ncbi:MAG TPA: (5-formylfuran-3-yl)methyl phosphate synthase [Gammaproteobacteria bacterium]|nr:(5-formylfuran-3-yl)methyl phosphate synthase [Gammaproteobacteria bacterium]
MTALLASVRSLFEARIALEHGADIIDLKEPDAGALGAVSEEVARSVVKFIDGRVPISATIGDELDTTHAVAAVQRLAELGANIIKVGLFNLEQRMHLLSALRDLSGDGLRIVAVIFADVDSFLYINDVAEAGLHGVMVDTAAKERGSLRQLIPDRALAGFVARAREAGLYCGLAGSLRLEDIQSLLALAPDYLGFRGALCGDGRRTETLDAEKIRQIRDSLNVETPTDRRMLAGG